MAYPIFKAAIAHASPVFLDRTATIEKACDLIREAARHGAELLTFPEAYVPAFPIWAALWAPIANHDFFRRMVEESVDLAGPEVAKVRSEARKQGIFVSLGISERNPVSAGGLWNSNLLISDEGKVLLHHRKLVPTFYEKLVWSNGDGSGLRVADTRLGKIGALICGENTNPLARYSLMAQGEQVHISTWPAIWPTRKPSSGGNYDLAGAVRIRAGAHSFEAKAFGVVCAGFLSREMHDFLVDTDPSVAEILEGTPRAASLFITPTGEPFGDSLQNDEGILYGHIDINQCVEPKQFHDVVGSYNRFDIFKLTVDRSPHRPAVFLDDTGTREGHGSATGLISSTIPDDGVELRGKDENQL